MQTKRVLVLAVIVAMAAVLAATLANGSGSAQTPTGTSYIIVHAVNPEGIEIASIEGMNRYSVRIYDEDTLIGYGAHDSETHNQPLAISPGSHRIKAVFNGMTLERDIDIQEGELGVIEFVFDREELNVLHYLSQFTRDLEAHAQGSGTNHPSIAETVVARVVDEPYAAGAYTLFNCANYWNNVTFEYDLLSRLTIDVNSDGVITNSYHWSVDFTCSSYGQGGAGSSSGYWHNWEWKIWTEEYHTSFDDWYIQMKPYTYIRLHPASEAYPFQHGIAGTSVYKHFDYGGSYSNERTFSDQIRRYENMKMSSVPYDMTGTGVGEVCPPVFAGTYAGSVRVDGQPAADGMVVTASVDAVQWGSTASSGGRYVMDIPDYMPSQAPCFDGGTITFELNGGACSPSPDWASGLYEVDLVCQAAVETPVATPTATPEVTPTPTVTPVAPPPTGGGGLLTGAAGLPWAAALGAGSILALLLAGISLSSAAKRRAR